MYSIHDMSLWCSLPDNLAMNSVASLKEKQGNSSKKSFGAVTDEIAELKDGLDTTLDGVVADLATKITDVNTSLATQAANNQAEQATVNAAVQELLEQTLAEELGSLADRLDAAGITEGFNAGEVVNEIRGIQDRVAKMEADIPCVQFDEVRDQSGKRIGCKMRTLHTANTACKDAQTTRIEGEDVACSDASGLCVVASVKADCPVTCGGCE
jgi:hypothetical protein